MKKKSKNNKIKITLTPEEIGKEARHRSRIFFNQQKVAGQIIESKKHRVPKHRKREEMSWNDE